MRHLDDMFLGIFKTIRNICFIELVLFCPQYQNAQLVQISAKNIFYIRSYLEKMTQIGSHYQNILRGLIRQLITPLKVDPYHFGISQILFPSEVRILNA